MESSLLLSAPEKSATRNLNKHPKARGYLHPVSLFPHPIVSKHNGNSYETVLQMLKCCRNGHNREKKP